jgi:uncharacterized spore protein YtfJ
MELINELLAMVSGELTDAAQSDVVVGATIELGTVRIVPLSRLSLGMGLGGGEGEGEIQMSNGRGKKKLRPGRGKGSGGLSGIGAKVRPVGVAIFTEDDVQIISIADRKGIIDKIFDKIPKVMELVERHMDRREGRLESSSSEERRKGDPR